MTDGLEALLGQLYTGKMKIQNKAGQEAGAVLVRNGAPNGSVSRIQLFPIRFQRIYEQ